MPALGQYQYLLDNPFFLYPSEDDARAGRNAGGTGFFVAIPSESYPDHYHHQYAVTNWHVACDGSPVIRINSVSGPPVVFPLEPHEWFFKPNFHDIAVVPIDGLDSKKHRISSLRFDSFGLTEAEIATAEINAGDDVFMLGRFVDYDGGDIANVPAMRFGNISMMSAHIEQPNGYAGRSLVVDMHSRTGFSGSPVFVYRNAGSFFPSSEVVLYRGHTMKLLGILWGQFPEEWDLKLQSSKSKSRTQAKLPVLTGQSIEGMSGMSLVSPASAIQEVLNLPRLKKHRDDVEKQLHKDFANAPKRQSKEKAETNPNHREDFNRLLGGAVKPPKSSDRT